MPKEKDTNSYVLNEVWGWIAREGLSGSLCGLTLLHLAIFPRPRKTAAPTKSISTLAAEIHCNKATISRALRKLIQLGYVRQVWKRGLAYETAGAPPEYHTEGGYQIVLRGNGIDARKAGA
jgi:hypothetical protein